MANIPSVEDKRIIKWYCDEYLSMQQIADKLEVSVNKVAYRLGKHGIARRNRSDATHFLNLVKHGKGGFCIKQRGTAREEKLKLAGVMLYWGEGTKGGGTVALSNSEPELIALFLLFLRKICGVSEGRLRITLHVYPDHDIESTITFWTHVTGLSREQFGQPFVHHGRRGTYKKRSKYGTVAVKYSDKRLLQIILTWIEEYKKTLLNNQPK